MYQKQKKTINTMFYPLKKFLDRCFLILSIFLLTALNAIAQIPEGVPHPEDGSPIDMNSTGEVLFYIALPILLIILFVIYRYRAMKKKDEE